MKNVVTEIVHDKHGVYLLKWIPIESKEFGSEGIEPKRDDDCRLGGGISCVSGSGGSMCSGYMGHLVGDVIRCGMINEQDK